MTLVITLLAAAIATIAWYAAGPKSTMKIGALALMYWGAGLMWVVDGIACLAEGEAFIEITDTAAMPTILPNGISTSICLRLWTFAPRINILSIITLLQTIKRICTE